MADRVRLQAIIENNPETWADVGPDGINLPVDVTGSVLPTGAATSNNQTNGLQKTQVVDATNNPIDFATSAKQLPDNHQVTVSNPTANPETGLAKETTLADIKTLLADPFSGYGLYAVDSDDATYFYVMYQNLTPVWIIIRITLATGITNYSKGTGTTSTAWTGRAGQTYADYDVTFS